MDPDQRVPLRHLERALAIDPDYIKALAGVSTTYGAQSNFAPTTDQGLASLARMDRSTARAVEANPDLWMSHGVRGNYYFEHRDYTLAARSFRRVASLDKGIDPELREHLALYELVSGRPAKALTLLDSNETIDPISRNNPMRVWALSNAGRHEDAIELFERLSAADSGKPQPFEDYAFWAHLLLGPEAEAIRFAERYDPVWYEGLHAFKVDRALPSLSPPELRRWAARRYGTGGHFQLANTALFASHYGHPELAVDLLRLAFERPGGYAAAVLWYPAMAGARKTNEFEEFVTDVGLVKFWRESGQWPDACRPVSAMEITCT
jgi:tetratricopeptide (TPR) repeat protein